MRSPVNDALGLAFDVAAGRAPAANLEPAGRALLDFARRVVEVGRRVASAPACPAALLRRAAALPDAPPVRSSVAAVWKLLFDSGTGSTALAHRGGPRPRFLRYAGAGGSLDVEFVRAESGDVRVHGTVDPAMADPVGAASSGAVAVEVAPRRGKSVRVPVRAGGAFSVTLASGAGPFTLTVRAGRRILGRTGPIPPVARR